MSSQAQSGVPFSIAAELRPCRLLELPPDLLACITSPGADSLHFKAPDASSSESFLCTSDKTYQLRQVHTSNSVYVTTSAPGSGSSLVPPALTAVSLCASVLEAVPAPAHHARSILASLLTPLNDPQDLEAAVLHPRTREHVFAHTPMSRAECQSAWEDLLAFEFSLSSSVPAQSFRPTATALAKVWKWLLDLAYVHNVDLAARPLQEDLLDTMLQEEDEWPRPLVDAIFSHLSQEDDKGLCLRRDDSIKWIGHNLLEARQQSLEGPATIETSAFTALWKDALPETWRKHVSLDMLGASYKLSAGGRNIESASEHASHSGTLAANPPKPATGPAAHGKRKWHEKFAAARKQGKPS